MATSIAEAINQGSSMQAASTQEMIQNLGSIGEQLKQRAAVQREDNRLTEALSMQDRQLKMQEENHEQQQKLYAKATVESSLKMLSRLQDRTKEALSSGDNVTASARKIDEDEYVMALLDDPDFPASVRKAGYNNLLRPIMQDFMSKADPETRAKAAERLRGIAEMNQIAEMEERQKVIDQTSDAQIKVYEATTLKGLQETSKSKEIISAAKEEAARQKELTKEAKLSDTAVSKGRIGAIAAKVYPVTGTENPGVTTLLESLKETAGTPDGNRAIQSVESTISEVISGKPTEVGKQKFPNNTLAEKVANLNRVGTKLTPEAGELLRIFGQSLQEKPTLAQEIGNKLWVGRPFQSGEEKASTLK